MTTVQKLLEQIQGAKKSLESHLSIPADQRNENYASARDGMVENLKGLQADFSAAQLADLPEDDHGSKAQRKAEVDNNAVNRVEMSQAKANGFDFNVKAARAGIMAGQKTIELPDVNFDANEWVCRIRADVDSVPCALLEYVPGIRAASGSINKQPGAGCNLAPMLIHIIVRDNVSSGESTGCADIPNAIPYSIRAKCVCTRQMCLNDIVNHSAVSWARRWMIRENNAAPTVRNRVPLKNDSLACVGVNPMPRRNVFNNVGGCEAVFRYWIPNEIRV